LLGEKFNPEIDTNEPPLAGEFWNENVITGAS
jgi:hypothetical protein